MTDLIHGRMSEVMKTIQGVPKDGWNPGQSFAFRSIETTTKIVHDALVKHQVIILPEVLEVQRSERTTAKGSIMRFAEVLVRYRFAAEDGSSVEVVSAGEAADTGDKATSKALSMALKYALFQTFLIPTGDPDPDSETAEEHVSGLIDVGTAKQELLNALVDVDIAKAVWDNRKEAIARKDLDEMIATAQKGISNE